MAQRFFDTFSGDPRADRRADHAEMLMAEGAPGAAAEVLLGALELAPGWAFGWFRLGEMHEAAGDAPAAARAWRTGQALDPADHAGAALKLALLGAAPQPDQPPSAFVETLFDQYAKTFDRALVDALGYRVPALLFEAIRERHPARFHHAVDLGCGTGLMGERLRPIADRLTGYDISAAMLAEARAKNLYDGLEKADLHDLPFAGEPAGLVTAADVFMYLGRLDKTFAAIRRMLAPGGIFALSVERHDGAEDFVLRGSRRYAHSETYVRRLLAGCGLGVAAVRAETVRYDRGEPVAGLIAVAAAPLS